MYEHYNQTDRPNTYQENVRVHLLIWTEVFTGSQRAVIIVKYKIEENIDVIWHRTEHMSRQLNQLQVLTFS